VPSYLHGRSTRSLLFIRAVLVSRLAALVRTESLALPGLNTQFLPQLTYFHLSRFDLNSVRGTAFFF